MITDGWYDCAERLMSPNQDARPAGIIPSLLVIHNISLPPGEFTGSHIKDFFCNALDRQAHPYFASIANLRVSSHLLIERCGRVTQFAPFTARAWHAGVSTFAGRERCNDFSIGVELEGTDIDSYTHNQYQQLACVTRELMAAYPDIGLGSIVGHSDIAPGRKTDPGLSFDWHRYFSLLRQDN